MIGRLLTHRTGRIGLILVALVVLAALVSLVWTPYDPLAVDAVNRWLPSSSTHLLGTDSLGRDLFSTLLVGAQVTLLSTVLASLIAGVLGVLVALLIALAPRVLSAVLQRFVDVMIAFPTLVLAIVLVTSFGRSTWVASLAIGLGAAVVITRTILPEIRRSLVSDYVLLADASGASTWRVMTRHVLPNVGATIVVRITQIMAMAALAEAGLSYLGFGTPAPTPSWGRTLADLQTQVLIRPEVLIAPSLAIIAVVMGFNLLGDGLRDALDPRATKGERR